MPTFPKNKGFSIKKPIINQPVVASGGDPSFTTRKVERATKKGYQFTKKK